MLDFTSSSYLGMDHAMAALQPWSRLSSGRPVALGMPKLERRVAGELAELVGSPGALLGPSTLHLFWDLFGLLATTRVAIYLDAGAYPIARWGVERARVSGALVRVFRHHDPASLEQRLARDEHLLRRPIVVTDGLCPGCGTVAPLPEYHDLSRRAGGRLIIDDTQALGLLGRDPSPDRRPYGAGGGGSIRFCGVSGPEVIVISSLAKGFGVPVAMIAGSRELIAWFERKSETRVHCSAPSRASLQGARHALSVNRADGEARRSYLVSLVRHFRRRLGSVGVGVGPGLLPVQTLVLKPEGFALAVQRLLLERGVRAVLQKGRCGAGPQITFLITAQHWAGDIDRAVRLLADALKQACTQTQPAETAHAYAPL